MIIVDLTLCGAAGGRPFHGGGEYGIFAAVLFALRHPGRVIALVCGEPPAPLSPHVEAGRLQLVFCTPETAIAAAERLADADAAYFVPIPYDVLKEGRLSSSLNTWCVVHGLRRRELIRMEAQGLPVRSKTTRRHRVRRMLKEVLFGRSMPDVETDETLVALRGLPSNVSVATVSGHTRHTIRLLLGAAAPPMTLLPPLPPFMDETGGRLEPAEPADDASRRGLLLLGGERPEKNVPRVLSAIARYPVLLDRLKDEGVHVTGSAAFMSGLPDRLGGVVPVHRLGYCSTERLAELYANCRVLVYPSMSEGYGLPPVDAFRLGCAVVATGVSAVSETTGGAAALFNPFDEEELAARLLQVLDDDAFRDALTAAGRRRYFTLREETERRWESFLGRWDETTGPEAARSRQGSA